MATVCRHCGMPSQADAVCSWCGKAMAAPQAQQPSARPQQPGVPGAPAPPSGQPSAPGPPAPPGIPAAPDPPPAEAAARTKPIWPYIAGGAGVVLLLVLTVVPKMVASRPPAEPTEWQQVNTKTRQLSLEVPANWHFSTAGSGAVYEWARVNCGRLCSVTIHGSGTKGSLADITASRTSTDANAMGLSTSDLGVSQRGEGRLHTLLGDLVAKEDKHFRDDGDMGECYFGNRAAAYSHYTTRKRVGLLTVQVKGRRVSAPAGELAYEVRAECPAQHWDKFEPIASRIIESVEMAGRED